MPGEDNPVAHWIFFAASGDSIAVSADSDAAVTTNLGEEKVGPLTASSFHKRVVRDGVLTVEVIIAPFMQGESPPYAIRFERFASSASALLRPSGQRAFLTIGLDTSSEMFAVIPLSKAKALADPSPWQVPSGEYRVALVADSLYVVCRKACSMADTVRLAPGQRVTSFH
jgi:hypothetical protein